MMQRIKRPLLSAQMKHKVIAPKVDDTKEQDGNFGTVISTGSTLLDLNISGGRIRGGGLPGGILVEVFGPSGSGKTVFLCEVAGAVQRQGGEIMFKDPEARINPIFAKLFDVKLDDENYQRPNTVPEVFKAIKDWQPSNLNVINGIFADSLTALSTDMEMEKDEGDKMGGRRAKEFSEGLRKTCRIIADKNYLMVCSNQIRQNMNAGPYEQKWVVPGGEAMTFYPSLRLRFMKPEEIREKRKIAGKEVIRTVGVETQIKVFKSSIWKPFRTAPVTILFDYGIDDIRQNLQFIKDHTGKTTYGIDGWELGKAMTDAIAMVEEEHLEDKLKNQVIDLWEEIESKFKQERKPKR